MRDVEFLPAWYPRQRRIRATLIALGSFVVLTVGVAVIVLLSLR